MVEIIVAIIGALGNIGVVALPAWLDKRNSSTKVSAPPILRPVSLAFVFIVAFFAFIGVWSSAATISNAYAFSGSAVSLGKLSLFFFVSGIASAIFGRCAVSHRQSFGTYVGYLSTSASTLFLLWSILYTIWPMLSRIPENIVNLYAFVTTLALAWALLLFWENAHPSSGDEPTKAPP